MEAELFEKVPKVLQSDCAFYISIKGVQEFQFLHIIANFWYSQSF